MPDPLANLRIRYHEIVRSVKRALHTQLGDAERLGAHRRDILLFMGAAELVSVFTEDSATPRHLRTYSTATPFLQKNLPHFAAAPMKWLLTWTMHVIAPATP